MNKFITEIRRMWISWILFCHSALWCTAATFLSFEVCLLSLPLISPLSLPHRLNKHHTFCHYYVFFQDFASSSDQTESKYPVSSSLQELLELIFIFCSGCFSSSDVKRATKVCPASCNVTTSLTALCLLKLWTKVKFSLLAYMAYMHFTAK